jgi:hypothetical protein
MKLFAAYFYLSFYYFLCPQHFVIVNKIQIEKLGLQLQFPSRINYMFHPTNSQFTVKFKNLHVVLLWKGQ